MSSVYGVVKQTGGFIWADSRVDKGTTVTILLPPHENGAANHRVERSEKPPRTAYRILIVEDTDAVRQTLTSMLEWHGFSVTAASTAEEALEFARTLRFDLLLTVVEANVEQLRQGLPDPTDLRSAADGIAAAAREAAMLTRQLLAFGRQQTLMPSTTEMNTLIGDAAPSLRAVLGDAIQIITELSRDLPGVRVDREQMLEVLTNLAQTAREAMPGGGSFTVATDIHAVTDEERRLRPWLPAGRFVRLRVTDTGRGMEEQALRHLF